MVVGETLPHADVLRIVHPINRATFERTRFPPGGRTGRLLLVLIRVVVLLLFLLAEYLAKALSGFGSIGVVKAQDVGAKRVRLLNRRDFTPGGQTIDGIEVTVEYEQTSRASSCIAVNSEDCPILPASVRCAAWRCGAKCCTRPRGLCG
jgi:hypothetical protein